MTVVYSSHNQFLISCITEQVKKINNSNNFVPEGWGFDVFVCKSKKTVQGVQILDERFEVSAQGFQHLVIAVPQTVL